MVKDQNASSKRWVALAAVVSLVAVLWGGYKVYSFFSYDTVLHSNKMEASLYGRFRVERLERDEQREIKRLLTEWTETRAHVKRDWHQRQEPPSNEPPKRTVCADFGDEPDAGPLAVKISVASWAEVYRRCERDLRLGGPRWWTLSWHGAAPLNAGDAFNNRRIKEDGITLAPMIYRKFKIPRGGTNGTEVVEYVPIPSILPEEIDDALAFAAHEQPDELPDANDPTFTRIAAEWEKVAFARFLLLFSQLETGSTLQFFACEMGAAVAPSSKEGSGPIALVKRLCKLNPNVRIAVYPSEVEWTGREGRHTGPFRILYSGADN
ncbi:MAG: hypothetical protein U0573_03135 [Phycisphaerales bacterium]|nr:hypothetical protein [Planctomycetota bacterium]